MKNDKYYLILALIVLFLCGTIAGYMIGKEKASDKLYEMCRQFDIVSYLNTELIRKEINNTFELTAMPNCDVYLGDISKGPSTTYDEWMSLNNFTHINWSDSKNG